jgi:hypothetical protein
MVNHNIVGEQDMKNVNLPLIEYTKEQMLSRKSRSPTAMKNPSVTQILQTGIVSLQNFNLNLVL